MDEGVEDSHAPVHAVLVDFVRRWVAFSVETMKDLDSIRQRGSSRRHDARLQAVTHGALTYTTDKIKNVILRYILQQYSNQGICIAPYNECDPNL